jgi:hypothetical protein
VITQLKSAPLVEATIILADAGSKCYTNLEKHEIPSEISELLITADDFYRIVDGISFFIVRRCFIRLEAMT